MAPTSREQPGSDLTAPAPCAWRVAARRSEFLEPADDAVGVGPLQHHLQARKAMVGS
jgi:hypothetical protein